MGISTCFAAIFTKRNKFYDFLLASLDEKIQESGPF